MTGPIEFSRRVWPSVALVLLTLIGSAAIAETSAILITVNGEEVTARRIDIMFGRVHGDLSPEGLQSFDSRSLLDKAVNDCLLSQQAEALEMDREPAIANDLKNIRRRGAVGEYRRSYFRPTESVPESEIRAGFEDYYWRIQVRQVTLREPAEAEAIRQEILSGADMDSLAREVSLDVLKNRGGLHNLKYWRDVELEIRPPAIGLQEGEVSEVFPYRGVWSVIRCEDRTELVEAEFTSIEPSIRKELVDRRIKAEWQAFVDSLTGVYPIEENEKVLAAIRTDAALVLDGSFLQGSDDIALSGSDHFSVTERELRTEISHLAMQDGTLPFEELYEQGLQSKKSSLVLARAAQAAGFYDSEEVEELVEYKGRDLLIEAYLKETIASRIVFNRDELNEFYEEHIEQWRGPEEVLLDVLVIPDLEKAQEMERRLVEGADFDFLREQMGLGGGQGQSAWTPLEAFSPTVKAEVERLEIGQGSAIITIPTGSMLFQLEGRRPGKPKSFEEVEFQVRGVVFQRKFNVLLDEHLTLLKERSEIEYHEEAIEAYYGASAE